MGILATQATQANNSFAIDISVNPGKRQRPFNAQRGEWIAATLTSIVGDKAEFTAVKHRFSFSADASGITGKVGDTLYFEVMQNDKNGIKLKQVNTRQMQQQDWERAKQMDINNIHEMLKQNDMSARRKSAKEANMEEAKTLKVLNNIKRQLMFGARNVDTNAVSQLVANGISLEKISFTILSTVMTEIKNEVMRLGDQDVERAVAEYFPQESLGSNQDTLPGVDVKKAAHSKYQNQKQSKLRTVSKPTEKPEEKPAEDSKPLSSRALIQKALEAMGVPDTDQNIKDIRAALRKVNAVLNLDESKILGFLKSDKEMTLSNVYRSTFTNTALQEPNIPEELEKDIGDFFDRESFEDTADNRRLARMFIANDVGLTKDNLQNALFLLSLHGQDRQDAFIKNAVKAIKSDEAIMEMPLAKAIEGPPAKKAEKAKEIMNNYKTVIDGLEDVSLEKIEYLVKQQEKMTLRNVATHDYPANMEKVMLHDPQKLQAVTAERQVAELRLKLTLEAASRLAGQEIEIDTMPLQKAVMTLRAMERELAYGRSLRMMGVESNHENLMQMDSFFTKLRESAPLTHSVFGDIINQRITFSIDSVHNAVMQARKMSKEYERYTAVPNAKYGDSFDKVKDMFAPLLDSLEIASTNENCKAASILSKNEIDVNEDNITKVKLIDEKVTTLHERFHPAICASIIKKGINPLDLDVDGLLQYIDSFEEEFGTNTPDTLAKHLLEMDKDSTLTDTEKTDIMEIYRSIHTIQKYNGVGLESALQENCTPTLGDMLEAAQYYNKLKKRGNLVDLTIQEDFSKAREMNNAHVGLNQPLAQYTLLQSDALAYAGDHKTLSQFIRDNPNYREMPVEDVRKLVDEIRARNKPEIEKQEEQTYLKTLQDVFDTPASVVLWLQERGIEATPSVIEIAKQMVKDDFYFEKQFKSLDRKLKADPNHKQIADKLLASLPNASLTSLKEGGAPEDILDGFEAAIKEAIDEQWEQPVQSATLLEQLTLMQNAVQVQTAVQRSPLNRQAKSEYKFPVQLTNRVAQLNMYVLNPDRAKVGQSNTLMSLQTESIGRVDISIFVNGNRCNLQISSDNKDGVLALEANRRALRTQIEAMGFANVDIIFAST